jgi:hypothetical protein
MSALQASAHTYALPCVAQIEWSACIIEHTVIDEINILQVRSTPFHLCMALQRCDAPNVCRQRCARWKVLWRA